MSAGVCLYANNTGIPRVRVYQEVPRKPSEYADGVSYLSVQIHNITLKANPTGF
jgi:hypothetical protein